MVIIPFKPLDENEDDTCDNKTVTAYHHGKATSKIKWEHELSEPTFLCINCLKELKKALEEVL